MSDDLLKRLRSAECTAGCGSMKVCVCAYALDAADRIEQLEAALLAADELARVIDTPNQSDVHESRYHYDWHRIDEAIDAYNARRATGGGDEDDLE